ncbi:MAG TPA: oxidoreductase [Acidimicrobiales bacterium]|nr:oxidoreductase [Acidimicrobiales bacterium]
MNDRSFTDEDAPLAGRLAVVTGGNGGLGLATAKGLGRAGAHVVIAARNPDKATAALDELRRDVPGVAAEVVALDLGSLDSIRTAAEAIVTAQPAVDVLVNNAGVMGTPEQTTADGFELQLGVNHLGHFAFTALLLPALLQAERGRVVTVTSTAHHMGRPVDPDDPFLRGDRYGPWKAYGQSKLANYFFALGLQQRFDEADAPVISLLAHPGLSDTELQAASVSATDGGASQRFFHWLASTTGMSAERGALPQLRAALDPEAKGGQFYAPRFVNFGDPVRRPVLRRFRLGKHIDDLWAVSERETGVALDVTAAMLSV